MFQGDSAFAISSEIRIIDRHYFFPSSYYVGVLRAVYAIRKAKNQLAKLMALLTKLPGAANTSTLVTSSFKKEVTTLSGKSKSKGNYKNVGGKSKTENRRITFYLFASTGSRESCANFGQCDTS